MYDKLRADILILSGIAVSETTQAALRVSAGFLEDGNLSLAFRALGHADPAADLKVIAIASGSILAQLAREQGEG